MPEILILTGPPGAGKSTVAEALGERYDRVAHIQVDALRHFVTPTGFVKPHHRGGERQVRLGVRNASGLARNFIDERFGVIIDDIVIDAEGLSWYLEDLRPCGAPIHFIRLMPSLEECARREANRPGERVAPGTVARVYREMEAAGAFAGVTIDSTRLSAQEAADRVQALTTSGESIVWAPPAATAEQAGVTR